MLLDQAIYKNQIVDDNQTISEDLQELLKSNEVNKETEEALAQYKQLTTLYQHQNKLPPLIPKKSKLKDQDCDSAKWFGMQKVELTKDLKNELNAIKLRNHLDPKRFYKKDKDENFPERVQIGTVISGPLEKHADLKRIERKQNLIDQMLYSDQNLQWTAKKYNQMQLNNKQKKRKISFKKQKKKYENPNFKKRKLSSN